MSDIIKHCDNCGCNDTKIDVCVKFLNLLLEKELREILFNGGRLKEFLNKNNLKVVYGLEKGAHEDCYGNTKFIMHFTLKDRDSKE